MKPRPGEALAAITVLVLASLACIAEMQQPAVIAPVLPTATTLPLIKDNFSDRSSGWDTAASHDSAVEYDNGGLRMRTFKPNGFLWSNPSPAAFESVHVEVTATNLDGNLHTGFGILCDQQPSAGSYYYFAITPGGQYEIGKSVMGQQSVPLTGEGGWSHTNLIATNATSYRLGADCAPGRLTLYVDGRVIDSVRDTEFTKGEVGLFLSSGQAAGDVLYDDFLLMKLR